MEKKCLSCISGLPFLGIPLLESPLLEPTWLGDLGEFGDLEWTEICNGETDNGSALSEADRTSSRCTFDVVSVLVKNIKMGLSLKFKASYKPVKIRGPIVAQHSSASLSYFLETAAFWKASEKLRQESPSLLQFGLVVVDLSENRVTKAEPCPKKQ